MTIKQQDIKQFDILLQKHIDNKDIVKIERTVTEGEANIEGFLLDMNRQFLLIQKEEEFYLNGYAIIRKDQFDRVRCNKTDKAFKKMLKSEGIMDKFYGIDKKINLASWESIFKSLKNFDYHVIVECELLPEQEFYLGPIKRITKTSVGIQFYDTTGLLPTKASTIKYKDITLVKFDDRYLNVFRKYLRTSNKK